MKKTYYLGLLLVLLAVCMSFVQGGKKEKWISLFDGKSLNGWKVGENAGSFKVENGTIVVNGDRAHLFYDLKRR
jgi:hypothetical protein